MTYLTCANFFNNIVLSAYYREHSIQLQRKSYVCCGIVNFLLLLLLRVVYLTDSMNYACLGNEEPVMFPLDFMNETRRSNYKYYI